MGRRTAELVGVLVASLITSYVTGLAISAPGDPVIYVVSALVPLALLLVYWLWIEPRADADRIRARRLARAVEDAFELTHPQTDAAASRDVARRAFYDRLEISDLFEPNHIEASTVLGDALDAGRALLGRISDQTDDAAVPSAEIGAWETRTAATVEFARGANDAMSFSHGPDEVAGRKRLEYQLVLLELWAADERKRAGERARNRYH
jgi:hypothetical protein